MQHPTASTAPFPLAFGVGTLWFEESREEISRKIVDGIKTALEVGYRHIDSAQMYNNERELGVALEESGVPRSELFITNKTLNLDDPESALVDSLANLKTSYVDMYLIHAPFPVTSPSHLQEAWRKMEVCVDKSLAKNIGVSSFSEQHIDILLETARIRPAVDQVEMHPYLPQSHLKTYLDEKGIPMEAFACLIPLTNPQPGPVNGIIKSLSDKYGVSESTILLKWVTQQGIRAVTTSGRKERLQSYVNELAAFDLDEKEIEAITDASKDTLVRMFFAEEFGALDSASST
ncbi:Aldo-ket-red domain-containing protein [Fusarium sp. LHS14.1]|nr:Aldo-ket-red domain-containing protein [Fusarium sp. LHS14.1]